LKKELAISLMIGCLIVGLILGYGVSQLSGYKTGSSGAPGPPNPASTAIDPAIEQEIKFYKQMVDSDPKNAEVLVQLGNRYYDTGSFQNAIVYYERALAIKPNNANVITDLGTSYLNLNQNDKAVELFKRAMKVDPKHGKSRFNLGVALLHGKNDARGAIAAWEEFLRLEPNDPQAPKVREQIQELKRSLKG
jgi:cytochrome c-type biogenesis protein CcmH/NrfG